MSSIPQQQQEDGNELLGDQQDIEAIEDDGMLLIKYELCKTIVDCVFSSQKIVFHLNHLMPFS